MNDLTSNRSRSRAIVSTAKPALNGAMVAGLAGLMLAPSALAAETTTAARPDSEVSGIEVTGAQSGEASSPKYTAPLRDTPQTIQVIPAAVIEAQNLMTLRDVLSTVPGITFGAGEGGGGYGDSINLRGYSANSDITVDGVRDSAQYTRSDPFNLEQIEVVNGANSVYSGAGSVGGSINLVTKTANSRQSTTATVAGGTDDYGRVALDSNMPITDTIAVRLNAMAHRNDVPGRDVEQYKRWGFAPSLAIGLGTPTTFTLSWLHQQDDNIPQYGTFYYNGGPVPGIDPSLYFGYANLDRQKINVDTVTGVLAHNFSDTFGIRNLSRWQEVTQYAVVNPPQGAPCLANSMAPAGWSQTATATNLSGYVACTTPGLYQPGGPRGNLRDSRNTLLYNQTDLTMTFNTGSIEHNAVLGLSLMSETFELDTGNVLRNPGAATPNPVLAPMSITSPNNIYAGPVNYIRGSIQYGDRRNQAIYLFDTIKLSEQFQINGGIRFEHNEGENRTDSYGTTPATLGVVTPGLNFGNEENLLSYRAGLVYKPQPNVSLYAAYGNSQTPSQTSVNGACSAATCNVDPEEAVNYEIGAKWDTFGNRLSLTAAVFRNERTNYRVPSADPTIPDQVLQGSSRVDGIALGAAGRINDKWAVFANYTYLKSKVLQGVSSFAAGGGVTGTEADFTKGDDLVSVPDHGFSLWTTYDVTPRFQLGYGVTYTGEMYLSQHTGIARVPATTPASFVGRSTIPLMKSEAFSVHRLMARYTVTRSLDLTLNVANVFNEKYFMRIRNNGWATPGDTRSATLTANYRF